MCVSIATGQPVTFFAFNVVHIDYLVVSGWLDASAGQSWLFRLLVLALCATARVYRALQLCGALKATLQACISALLHAQAIGFAGGLFHPELAACFP